MSNTTNHTLKYISPSVCPHIIVDVDEVLADTLPDAVTMLNAIHDMSLTPEDIHKYDFTEFYPTTQQQIVSMFAQSDILKKAKPFPGAMDALHRIRKLGYRIHIVSARASFPGAFIDLMDWLGIHGGIYDSISLNDGLTQTKSSVYLSTVREAAYIVDDGLHNIRDAIMCKRVHEYVVVNAPWNATDEHPTNRVDSVVEFADFLEKAHTDDN